MTIALHEILKIRILDAIRSVQPPGGWKVVVVDEASLKIIESACKMFDILEEKVTLVENLEKPRQAYQSLDAVYIITPTFESINKVIEDRKNGPLYAGVHLFFTSRPDDRLLHMVDSSLPKEYMRQRHDLFIEFHAKEAHVYSFESPSSFFKLYSPADTEFDNELRIIAKKLLSVCISMGENPLIRYQRSLDSDHATKALPYKLAMLVQNELDSYVRLNPGFPPQDSPRPRGILFIVDRTIDMYAPFLHEFTYQAMANDLLPIENGHKYEYNYTGEDGTQATKEAILDESDKIWVEIRHKHMKDCIDKLMKDFNEFLTDNQGFAEKDKAVNLNDMKKMLATLPQFQNMKEKFSVHLNIAQECMSLFERERLAETATMEQNCATGHTADGAHPKTLVEDMVPLLDNPVVSSLNKTRMLMLYIMYKNGILEEDRRKLLAHARITLEENDALNNLTLFGIKLLRASKNIKKNKKYRQKPSDDIQYEISRYIPRLKLVIESHINGQIDHTAYPYTKDPTGDPDGSKGTQQGPVSLRSARAGWYKKGQAVENRVGRIIVFVAGGVTYSELRSAYEISENEKLKKDVVIGSTHIITPQQFVDDLKVLRTRGYAQPPVQPQFQQPQLQQPQLQSTPPQLPPRQGLPPKPDNAPNYYMQPQPQSQQQQQNRYYPGGPGGYGQQQSTPPLPPPQQGYSSGGYGGYQQGYSPSGYPQGQPSYQTQAQTPYYGIPPNQPNQQYANLQKPSSASSSSSTSSSKPKSKLFEKFDFININRIK
ncbi:unnamed protein product [Rhizophagus irregularis]|nr:unnamed protein product [Rhizophagus irregularis]